VKKIALFADVQNLYYTVRQAHGCHFNYSALWADVSRRGTIVEAYAYAIERGDPRQQQFQQILRKLGFTVKLKPYIQRSDGSAKGDWDVGITIDVLDAAARVDEVVLASGDGDFDLLLERVRAGGSSTHPPQRSHAVENGAQFSTLRLQPRGAVIAGW